MKEHGAGQYQVECQSPQVERKGKQLSYCDATTPGMSGSPLFRMVQLQSDGCQTDMIAMVSAIHIGHDAVIHKNVANTLARFCTTKVLGNSA